MYFITTNATTRQQIDLRVHFDAVILHLCFPSSSSSLWFASIFYDFKRGYFSFISLRARQLGRRRKRRRVLTSVVVCVNCMYTYILNFEAIVVLFVCACESVKLLIDKHFWDFFLLHFRSLYKYRANHSIFIFDHSLTN